MAERVVVVSKNVSGNLFPRDNEQAREFRKTRVRFPPTTYEQSEQVKVSQIEKFEPPFTLQGTKGDKMKQLNILFVCKHNIFRSKIAEAYFKKVNKNKKIKVASAGIIKSDTINQIQKKLIKLQRKTAKEFGIELKEGSKQISSSLLKEQDLVIVVANNISEKMFSDLYTKSTLKIIRWKIPDVKGDKNDAFLIKDSIKKIIKKVNLLVKKLERKK